MNILVDKLVFKWSHAGFTR